VLDKGLNFGLMCRTYRGGGTAVGAPSVGMICAALRRTYGANCPAIGPRIYTNWWQLEATTANN
jgi:hypothetical protein